MRTSRRAASTWPSSTKTGVGSGQNYNRAARLYRQVCNEGSIGEACFRLAGMYRKGAGVYPDTMRANGLMREA